MKFGFIAHPVCVEHKRYANMIDLLTRGLAEQAYGYDEQLWKRKNIVPFMNFDRIVSATGAECSGKVFHMPLTAEEMLLEPRVITKRVISGVAELQNLGAELVGLGGFTGIVGNRGLQTLENVSVPVTTGNSLTAYAAYQNVLEVMQSLGLSTGSGAVAIVGYPGSIALVIAKLLLADGFDLMLVHRSKTAQVAKLLNYLPEKYHSRVELTNSIEDCYKSIKCYVAATSSGSVIDPYSLASGAVVIDVALPSDVKAYKNDRSDLLVLEGGLVSANKLLRFGGESFGLAPKNLLNGCLAETLLLALENRRESFSIGRELEPEKVLEVGRLADAHGLKPDFITSDGKKAQAQIFHSVSQYYATSNQLQDSIKESNINHHRDKVLNCFHENINPVLADFYAHNSIQRVFSHAKGCWLTDHNGRKYLDFVAGYGCLNTGHNHDQLTSALNEHLLNEKPTFVQYVSVPEKTSLLAKRLAEMTGRKTDKVFFSNSGTEAIEAAIKVALAAMAKPRILYCENGYHGKTLGALSVTGRAKHRRVFEPLLPRCSSIKFSDLDSLTDELSKGDVGAFVLEPIQGEGGVIIPHDGYLAAVREACDRFDCLLILDEVQTGLARTGKFLCCDWDNIQADILVLAKSLSGGLVPIGATMINDAVWQKAYGSMDTFALHTSTFGGGNLAATAGLATLDVIENENLAANALQVGAMLMNGLQEIAGCYSFIKQVRGRGLMLAIEFENDFSGSVNCLAQEFSQRIPGDARATYAMLSDKAKYHINSAIAELEKSFEEMFVMRMVTKLSEEHGVLTFVTANNNKIMRIQPPLVLSESEAQHFLSAFSEVCDDMATFVDANKK